MKYTAAVTVNIPRSEMIELFDDPDRLPSWQPDLIGIEPKAGIPGQQGARMQLRYRVGPQEIDRVQTVLQRNFPYEFRERYDSPELMQQIHHRFSDLDGIKTRWEQDCEVRQLGWLRWFSWLMLGAFRRRTLNTMKRFKLYAESQSNAQK
ncbi:SRPBCC family protein [Reinekea blandensis]|uniref:SRPBCC family protein n=1 Tax=Reinekea blandensis MED297 TaxID=314283 RepID=A4B9T7_9GAMM|nr:SRPBCC family protein [Reinekea blandensis]EAR11388.1 hypothetical protein MED297_20912 [Reinekea sp. MED297] [Reinekea blandensis MED297]